MVAGTRILSYTPEGGSGGCKTTLLARSKKNSLKCGRASNRKLNTTVSWHCDRPWPQEGSMRRTTCEHDAPRRGGLEGSNTKIARMGPRTWTWPSVPTKVEMTQSLPTRGHPGEERILAVCRDFATSGAQQRMGLSSLANFYWGALSGSLASISPNCCEAN